jgi:hypothetical protein
MHLEAGAGGTANKDYDTAVDNLIALMDEYGVAGALVLVPPREWGEPGAYDYHELLAPVGRYPDRLHLVAGGGTLHPLILSTDPAQVTEQIEARFEAQAEEIIRDGAVAFGEMCVLHLCLAEHHVYEAAPADHPLFLLLADLAARHGVPIDLHMEALLEDTPTPANLARACDENPSVLPATIPAFERLLANNRQARIVWQHIGWDNTGELTADLVRRLFEDHPNLYVGLKIEDRPFQVGGGGPMPNRLVDGNGQLLPEWRQLIEDYPERFVMGADEFIGPSGRAAIGIPTFSQTWAIIDQLPPDLARQVGHDNVVRIYNLD